MYGSQSEDWSRWLGARGHWPQLLPPAMSVINTDKKNTGEIFQIIEKYFAHKLTLNIERTIWDLISASRSLIL